MDRATFDRKIQKLKSGEFLTDPSFYAYASDSLYELKTITDALWQCCSAQAEKIQLLEKKNQGLQNTNKELTGKVFELHQKLCGVSSSPFDDQITGGKT